MPALSFPRMVLKRLGTNRLLLASIFVSIAIASTVAAAAPVSLMSMERLALHLAIDKLRRPFSNVNAFLFNVPLTRDNLETSQATLEALIDSNLEEIYDGHERYIVVDTYLAGTPVNPLPGVGSTELKASRAYLRHFTNLEQHVRFLQGRMAGEGITSGSDGLQIEAVVSRVTAETFGLDVEDVITLTPALGSLHRMSIEVVGIVEATDPVENYWSTHAAVILDPPPVEEEADGEESNVSYDVAEPPAPLFIAYEPLLEAVSQALPGTLIDSLWFIRTDREGLKSWSSPKTRSRLEAFEADFTTSMPGSEVFSSITRMLNEFDRRSFFSRVPLVLLLATIVVTVLFYLSMMVSYLVRSRSGDVAMLKTRGVGALQLIRLYALEGLLITLAAVAIAPFLAMGLVTVSGMLPYFTPMTEGRFLPIVPGPLPFLVALGTGALCLAIYVLPGALGVRAGVLSHKLESARPPTMPFFQRYYVDVALLCLGGLTFWELYSRGHVVSGGLFSDIEVNESLLLAPILFLVVVALVFIRAFPLLVRFVSGDSPALAHVLSSVALLGLGAAIAVGELQGDGFETGWERSAALLVAIGGAYWATARASRPRLRLGGLALQAVFVAGFVRLEPLEPGQSLFVPTIALLLVVPLQVVYMLLKRLSRRWPVWAVMGLWHMSRNPLQYTWLVLLLVMVTGVAILATTVGATLDRSHTDRIEYEVAADIRLTNLSPSPTLTKQSIKETFLSVPGVTSASLAFRSSGTAGPTEVEVFAVESREFPYISWYRGDFSERGLNSIMMALQAPSQPDRLEIPEGATEIGVWVRPEEPYSSISMWVVVQDGNGKMHTVTMGAIGEAEWHPMRSELSSELQGPLHLVSVQLYEAGFGSTGTPGALYVDDLHVLDSEGTVTVMEDFEGRMRWTPIITSPIASDRVAATRREPYDGRAAAKFSFGKETSRGIRGFYQSPTMGPVPIVVSSAFAEASGSGVGRRFIAEISSRMIPVVVTEIVTHFPTIRPDADAFLVADMDTLLEHLNILSFLNIYGELISLSPNEIFLAESPTLRQDVKETVAEMIGGEDGMRHRASMLEVVRLDPLASAGWKSMVLLALGIVVLAAGLGYVTYLLSFASQSKSEMGFLQSLGLSRRQLMSLLGFEHLAIAAMGLGLGTWAGFQMSRLMVSSIAVTQEGDKVVPPFVLMTNWATMGPTYAALAAIFLTVLYMINRSIRRLDLHAISRVEGY